MSQTWKYCISKEQVVHVSVHLHVRTSCWRRAAHVSNESFLPSRGTWRKKVGRKWVGTRFKLHILTWSSWGVQDGLNLVRASKEGEVEMGCQGHRDLGNEDLILKEAEGQVGKCYIIPRLFKFLKRRRKRRSREWHVYTALFKMDNQQRPTVAHRELCSYSVTT